MDTKLFRHILGHYPTGVCAITATVDDGRDVAMIVGTFTAISLDPPLVGFFPARSSRRWGMIERGGRFCANVLSSDQGVLCRQLAGTAHSALDGVKRHPSNNGSPILADALAWIDCDIERVIETGDHHLVLGRVFDLGVREAGGKTVSPLLFLKGAFGGFASFAAT